MEKRAAFCSLQHMNEKALLCVALCAVNRRSFNIQFHKQTQSLKKMILVLSKRHMELLVYLSLVKQLLEHSRKSTILLNTQTDVISPRHVNFFVLNKIVKCADQSLNVISQDILQTIDQRSCSTEVRQYRNFFPEIRLIQLIRIFVCIDFKRHTLHLRFYEILPRQILFSFNRNP